MSVFELFRFDCFTLYYKALIMNTQICKIKKLKIHQFNYYIKSTNYPKDHHT